MAQPPKITKSQAKDEARRKAAEQREAERKRVKRNKIVLLSSIGLVVVAIIAIIALVVANGVQNSQLAAKASNGPKNMASGGFVLTSTKSVEQTPASKNPVATKADPKKVPVQIVIDLQCPYCKQFEAQNSKYLGSLLDSGKITYEVHPVAFLSEYSNRAGNAVLCVANSEPEKLWDYLQLLYSKQPDERNPGAVTNSMLRQYAVDAGISDADTLSCIRSAKRYTPWLLNATNIVGDKGLSGTNVSKVNSTPTLVVDGKQVQPSLAANGATDTPSPELVAAIEAAAKTRGISLN
jgi:protein-disulfide isomerase